MRRIHRNKFVRFSSDKELLDNVSAHMGKGVVITIAGKEMNAADVKAVFQQRVDVTSAVDVKKAEYQGAVAAERNTLAATAQQADDIRQALLIFFRHKPEVLADLGLSPRKERKAMTGKEMVAKAAKAKATREGRHAPVVVNGTNGSASPQQ